MRHNGRCRAPATRWAKGRNAAGTYGKGNARSTAWPCDLTRRQQDDRLRPAGDVPKHADEQWRLKMRDKINDDLKTAMKAGEKDRVGTLRLINAAIKAADIEARPSGKDKISDTDILSVLAKMVKQRRDSIDQYTAGGRQDLVDKEQAEINVIEAYLPKQMSEDEAKTAIAAIIKEVGAAGPKDMGKVMAALKAKYAGQMDFGKASALTKDLLK